jgi:putative GTP pyrophosphokinase
MNEKVGTTLDDFLSRNRVESTVWEQSGLSWLQLQEIAADHDAQLEHLCGSAELFARVIQRIPTVHSVRWRVKDTDHLLQKIVRKCATGQEKYKKLDKTNYFEVVTDLVGLRALHLFKEDCFSIDQHLRGAWALAEEPIAYVREGDPQDLVDKFKQLGFEVKEHPAGYRSVHYVCATQPLQRKVFAEIQVRTIFEEGWSEIDHRVRYPNFSEDQLVSSFLAIFNRLAGSADEMGTFVQGFTRALSEFDLDLARANKEKEDALGAMEKMLADLEALKKQDAETKSTVASLQREVEKLRRLPSVGNVSTAANRTGLASLFLESSRHGLGSSGIGRPRNALEAALGIAERPSDALRKAVEGAGTNRLADILKDKKWPR